MSPAIKPSVMWMDSTFEIWKDLKDRFSHSDKFRIADLQDQIQNCKQGNSSISEYYTHLKIMWKELELNRCFLLCICSSPYSCGLISKLKKEREDDCVISFLHGLNDVYAPIRSQVMLMELMPSLVKTFSLVLQHEREFVGDFTSQSPTDTVAFSSVNGNTNVTFSNKSFSNNHKVSSNSGKGPKGNKLCTHCGKTNHIVET